MTRKTVFATDTNVLLQRSRFSYRELKRPDGHPSGAVYGTIRSIDNYLKRFKPDIYVPVFDVGKSKLRKGIDGGYKANREKKDPTVLSQFTAVRGLLELMGMRPYFEDGVEADDLVAKLVVDYTPEYGVMFCTQDHDLRQLVRPHAVMFKPQLQSRPDSFIKYDEFKEELGIEPSQLPDVWAIMGDPGDNITGLRGWGFKKSLEAIRTYGSLEAAIGNDPRLTPHAATLLVNKTMIALDGKVAIKKPDMRPFSEVRESMYGNEEVMDFFEQWGMKTFQAQYAEGELFGW